MSLGNFWSDYRETRRQDVRFAFLFTVQYEMWLREDVSTFWAFVYRFVGRHIYTIWEFLDERWPE